MLQRQCIATLSNLALNSSGAMIRPASREVVEKGLLFLAAFHWSKSVRGEADVALRRQQSMRNIPHPSAWSVQDCLRWLSCVDLDQMCKATKTFLYDGELIAAAAGSPAAPMLLTVPLMMLAADSHPEYSHVVVVFREAIVCIYLSY